MADAAQTLKPNPPASRTAEPQTERGHPRVPASPIIAAGPGNAVVSRSLIAGSPDSTALAPLQTLHAGVGNAALAGATGTTLATGPDAASPARLVETIPGDGAPVDAVGISDQGRPPEARTPSESDAERPNIIRTRPGQPVPSRFRGLFSGRGDVADAVRARVADVGAAGASQGLEIAVREDDGSMEAEATWMHEIAHVLQRTTPGLPRADARTAEMDAAAFADAAAAGRSANVHVAAPPGPLSDDKDEPREWIRIEVPVDREMGADEFLRELLRYRYGVYSPTLQDEIIAGAELRLPPTFKVSANDVKARRKRLPIPADLDNLIQSEFLGGMRHFDIVHGTPTAQPPTARRPVGGTYSKELAAVVTRLQELFGRGFFVAREEDLERLRRIVQLLEQMGAAEIEQFKKLAVSTDDAEAFEKSLRAFAAAGGKELSPAPAGKVTDPQLAAALAELGKLVGFKPGGVTPTDTAQILRIVALLRQFTPAQLEMFKTSPRTDDLDKIEASCRAILAGAKPKTADEPGAKAKAGAEVGLREKLDATWVGVTEKQFSGLDRAGRVALARRIAAKQRNEHLSHMVKHPGQTVKGMARGLVRVDELVTEVGKNLKEVTSGATWYERLAGASGAAKRVSGWLAGVIAVGVIVAFVINPALTLKVWMMRALALTIASAALALVESELRIQQAAESKTLAAFKLAVEKSAEAQTEFVAAAAMAALPLVGRLLGKVPLPKKVLVVVRGAKQLGKGFLWATRARVVTSLKALHQWARKAFAEEVAAVKQATAIMEGLTPEQFIADLSKEPKLKELTGLDDATIKQLQELAATPEGKQALGRLYDELKRSFKDAPDLARSHVDQYLNDLQKLIDELEAAKTPEQAQAAVEKAEKVMGEEAVGERVKQEADAYVAERSQEAAARALEEAKSLEAAEAARRDAEAKKAAAEKEPTKPAAPGPKGDPAAMKTWVETLEKKKTSGSSPEDLYEIRVTGPDNYLAKGGGEQVWADGVDIPATELLDSKFVVNPKRSVFTGTAKGKMPPYVYEKILTKLKNEFRRYAAVLNDPAVPATRLRVKVSDPQAKPFFEALMEEYGVPGEVVVEP